MRDQLLEGYFILSDPPEVSIEEVWVPHKTTFEVRLVCHVIFVLSHKQGYLPQKLGFFQVTWFKNENTRLSTSDEILIEDHKPKHVLKIEKLKVKNFGKYKCKASNALGYAEDTIEITGNIYQNCDYFNCNNEFKQQASLVQ